MRDDDYSFDMFALGCFAAGALFCLVLMIISFGIKNSIDGVSPEDIARCKSFQGEYGGGKCGRRFR